MDAGSDAARDRWSRRALRPPARTLPGDLLLGLPPVAALVVLVVNDHYLKGRGPGVVTGKLSDFAGLFLFPLVMVAVLEWARWCVDRRRWWFGDGVLVACAIATAVVFSTIKLSPAAGEVYQTVFGWLQWPFSTAVDVVRGDRIRGPRRVALVHDRTDLITVAMVVLSWCYGRRRVGRAREDPGELAADAGSADAGSGAPAGSAPSAARDA